MGEVPYPLSAKPSLFLSILSIKCGNWFYWADRAETAEKGGNQRIAFIKADLELCCLVISDLQKWQQVESLPRRQNFQGSFRLEIWLEASLQQEAMATAHSRPTFAVLLKHRRR
jgi:hypothetical protein